MLDPHTKTQRGGSPAGTAARCSVVVHWRYTGRRPSDLRSPPRLWYAESVAFSLRVHMWMDAHVTDADDVIRVIVCVWMPVYASVCVLVYVCVSVRVVKVVQLWDADEKCKFHAHQTFKRWESRKTDGWIKVHANQFIFQWGLLSPQAHSAIPHKHNSCTHTHIDLVAVCTTFDVVILLSRKTLLTN